ncbi:MAG: hypothetical protein HOE40_01285, partial [Candidatus Pacebacteria bacterium]|nr:hypothetical protein [Candidatus Paceibacterota bacterium]
NNKKIISFGNSQREIKKSNISENDLFNIYSYPSPEFIKDMKISAIFEQGDNYGFEKISKERFHYKSSVGDLDIDYKYRVWSELEKLFFALKNINPDYVVSELTQFTRETANVIDSCLCLGSGVAVASGIAETGVKYPIVVSGDTSFLHGMGFLEAIYRKLNLGLIIIENGGSWCTGGQQQLINNIDFCSKMGVSFKILDYKKTTQQDIEKELLKMKKKAELFVLFIKKDK